MLQIPSARFWQKCEDPFQRQLLSIPLVLLVLSVIEVSKSRDSFQSVRIQRFQIT
jgi:hypothetical protein